MRTFIELGEDFVQTLLFLAQPNWCVLSMFDATKRNNLEIEMEREIDQKELLEDSTNRETNREEREKENQK